MLSAFPASGYTTQLSIYLDTAWAAANPDVRFDWDVASSDSGGNFLQDFAFNAGTTPASYTGTAGFVISAGNNAGRGNTYPWNPGHNPVYITTSGWYTFVHHFYNDNGYLAADMSILDSGGNTVASWTLPAMPSGNPVPIADAGGPDYGWFANQEFPGLPIDNAALLLNGPAGKANFGFVAKCQKGASTPSGHLVFTLKAAGLKFTSNSYDGLVVDQNGTAQFTGTGSLDGTPGYRFVVWATDNGKSGDTFRIQVTDPSVI